MVRVQADPAPRLADWLETAMPSADIATGVPRNWSYDGRPLVVIADDSGPVQWPVKSDHTIRVTARAAGPDSARTVVRTAVGLLHTAKLTGIVISRSSGGVIGSRDSATSTYIASALMTIHARTEEL
ncbi:hypothetical protein [Gordonia sp. KTR9]|uniref:hypothetical protein n=1 Tax=Gordonia sp. KTR9 TaxID=337191 RepID=UPI000677E4C7|nr:hypothetical protein [Gordonia sp. KTR9]